MQLVSAPGGISAHDASFHPILSLVLAILRLISDTRCFYKYVYIYISNATGICPKWHFTTIYPPLHISMLPRSHTSTKAKNASFKNHGIRKLAGGGVPPWGGAIRRPRFSGSLACFRLSRPYCFPPIFPKLCFSHGPHIPPGP